MKSARGEWEISDAEIEPLEASSSIERLTITLEENYNLRKKF